MRRGRPEPLVHHELCFGCGRTNLFGLLLELERQADGVVSGRCFLKQDHQGAQPGRAHDGILATALSEAMSFACGTHVRAAALEVSVHATVPVGDFVELEARALGPDGDALRASATATFEGDRVATARGGYVPAS